MSDEHKSESNGNKDEPVPNIPFSTDNKTDEIKAYECATAAKENTTCHPQSETAPIINVNIEEKDNWTKANVISILMFIVTTILCLYTYKLWREAEHATSQTTKATTISDSALAELRKTDSINRHNDVVKSRIDSIIRNQDFEIQTNLLKAQVASLIVFPKYHIRTNEAYTVTERIKISDKGIAIMRKYGSYSRYLSDLPALPTAHPKEKARSHRIIKKIAFFWSIIVKHPLWSAIIAGVAVLLFSHFVFHSP